MIPVEQVLGENLPAHLRARIDEFYQANCMRLARLRGVTGEAIAELQQGGIETVLLKGFARADEYVPDPHGRMHYDISIARRRPSRLRHCCMRSVTRRLRVRSRRRPGI